MPMMICVKTVPVCVPPGRSQSQLPSDMELTHTLQRLRHTHSQARKPAVHTHRPLAKLGAPIHTHNQPDQILLHPCVSSRTCEPTSLSSSPSSSSSSSPVSKSGSPRLKRVVFADSVGLPLTEVRMFVGEPAVDAPMTLKRAPGPTGVSSGRCPLHQSMPASPQPGPDFPALRAARPQDRMPFQAHNDTLRRVNGNFQKAPTHGLPKAHMQANTHTFAATHGLPKAHPQANGHMHGTGQPLEHTHATMRTQTAEHAYPTAHTLPKAHTLLLPHQLPKGQVHPQTPEITNNQVVSQRPPSCSHSFMVSRQQSSAWQRSRSPLPQPDSPPRVHSLGGQSWAWQEGMAVH